MIANNEKFHKRKPLRKRIQKIVLLISVLAISLVSIVGFLAMENIKARSENALIDQMLQNMNNIVSDKVTIAELEIEKYKSYIDRNVKYIEFMYNHPSDFIEYEVLPPNPNIEKKYIMQRYYAIESYNNDNVKQEMNLLGNLRHIWNPMMQQDGEVIATVYVGTKSGFMLCYDRNSNLATLAPDGESYYDYFDRYWYKGAKEANGIVLTELTQDAYGRGLTLTCAAPFYNKREFAGVVAMDILVTDLQESIIDVNIGKGAFAFLVNKNGDIVASPFVDLKQVEFENIKDKNNVYNDISENILSGGGGISKTNKNIYCAYYPVPNTDWIFCTHVPEELILASSIEIEKYIRKMIILFIIAFLVICVIVVYVVRNFSKSITLPLLSLKKDVEVISGGELDKEAKIFGNDEISDLAHSFNNMTNALKKYIQVLTNVTAEKERISAELNVATQIQSSMLPKDFSVSSFDKSFDIYATMDPAKEVGGDFYDFFKIDDKHLAIVVADVSGKGVPAALFMVIGKTLIKDHSLIDRDLDNVFSEVNNLLCEANSEGLFITAFEAIINLETGHVVFVNAGHELPFIYRKDKEFTPFQMKASFVLAGMENIKYKGGEFDLNLGDKIFQYTDGVTEATNRNNELYGMERLSEVLNKNKNKNPKSLLAEVKADIDRFVDGASQFDDITMLGLEFLGENEK